MSEQQKILIIGLDGICRAQVESLMAGFTIVEKPYTVETLTEDLVTPAPAMVFCGPAPAELPLTEVAQGLRMLYQASAIYFVTSVRADFERKLFQKNGFTDAYLLPIETALFGQVVREQIARVSSGRMKSYRSVRLVDVTPGTELPFDTFIHLPANNKHIKFAAQGDPLDAERVARLKKHQVTAVEVTSDQIQDFYRFSAEQLKKLGSNQAISETERKDRMQSAIRDLMAGMFNDSTSNASTTHGKTMVNDCQEIVKAYVVSGGDKKNEWYARILSVTGSGTNTYSHASNVATIAALFSMGTGIGSPEELAMAGVLHDIGLADLPVEMQQKLEEHYTPEEKITYETHVGLTLKIIQNRKLVISDTVLKAIQQHHERIDGSGYPVGIAGKKVLPAAQLLALADEFDHLTAVREGHPSLSPVEAMKKIKEDCFKNPAQPKFEPEIVNKLMELFSTESSLAAAS
jgi:HD-GYP domain-containing protein (c-di-GMP phosphodiesterase class II)